MKRSEAGRGVLALAVLLALAGCRGGPVVRTEERGALTGLVARIGGDARQIELGALRLAAAAVPIYEDIDRWVAGVETNRYRFSPEGCYYKAVDDGGPALWVSGASPIDAALCRLAWATEGLDGDLRALPRELPAVAQAYFNEHRSLNRIYPPFDVLSQYEPGMRIPEFNFYFLADAAHNPGRGAVWVDEPYVDPAGRGWMVSCMAPVYLTNVLMGVVGLDVTVAEIAEHYLQPPGRVWALVAQNGTVVAATERAIELFDMPPLVDHRYVNTVKSDHYRTEDYNLLQAPHARVRRLAQAVLREGVREADLLTVKPVRVLAEEITSLRWTALLIVE